MDRLFIIRPFGQKEDSNATSFDFDQIQEHLIDRAVTASGLDIDGGTTGQILDSGNIREDMFGLILEADLVICDVTIHNANVFYELGIRHALRKRHTILLRDESSADEIPFDLLTDRYLPYRAENPEEHVDALARMIRATLRTDRDTDSPIFRMLGQLPEVDISRVQIVPPDFSDEVDRAVAARAVGWLRLLAREVQGERFKWAGLRLVGAAQWRTKDLQGALDSFKVVQAQYPDDIQANLALANIYERLSSSEANADLLTQSDHAIERVLENDTATRDARIEALSLEGRNMKTRWRAEFEPLASVGERRGVASNKQLRMAYEAYRTAFYKDLNPVLARTGCAATRQHVARLVERYWLEPLLRQQRTGGRVQTDPLPDPR